MALPPALPACPAPPPCPSTLPAEVLRSQPYNEKCDIYSYGVCLWELMTNQEPWQDHSPMQARTVHAVHAVHAGLGCERWCGAGRPDRDASWPNVGRRQRSLLLTTHAGLACCVCVRAQVVGAVGWDDQRLTIPDDVAPAMRDLIAACFGEPQGRPTFRRVRVCARM